MDPKITNYFADFLSKILVLPEMFKLYFVYVKYIMKKKTERRFISDKLFHHQRFSIKIEKKETNKKQKEKKIIIWREIKHKKKKVIQCDYLKNQQFYFCIYC